MTNTAVPAATEADFFQPPDIPEAFKKAVGVVQVAMGDLGLLHRKCYNVALANAYEGLGQGKLTFRMPIAMVAEWCEFNSNNYKALYDVFEELRKTQVKSITFDEKNLDKKGRPRRAVGSDGLLAGFKIIENGMIEYSFTSQMAQILYEPEQYIWMSLAVQNRFSSKYELNLFENCIRYVGIGTTGFKSVEDWRSVLGATEGTYDEFKRLNTMVLKPATKGVNSKSGILVEPEFEREKRKVARIKFKVAENPQMQLLDYKEHTRIRELEVFKKAVKLGLKDVEVIYWIETKGERFVAETVAYVEDKKPEKNPTGYLVNALKRGYGEKSPEERQKETETAKKIEQHKAQRDLDRPVFRDALAYRYWKRVFSDAQRDKDSELRERLASQPDQDALKNRFASTLGEDGFRKADFKKRGWDSLVSSSAMRKFAADEFGFLSLDEATFFMDNKLDVAALEVANAKIEKSVLYRGKLEDAASAIAGRGKVNLDLIVERYF